MIEAVVFLFMLLYPIDRFRRSKFDKRVRWQLMGIRWGLAVLAIILSSVWDAWNVYSRGDGTTWTVVDFILIASCYALGEWLVRRQLKAGGIEIRETIRGVNY